jgi:hypothetical protein
VDPPGVATPSVGEWITTRISFHAATRAASVQKHGLDLEQANEPGEKHCIVRVPPALRFGSLSMLDLYPHIALRFTLSPSTRPEVGSLAASTP